MRQRINRSIVTRVLIVVLFAILLLTLRLAWIHHFEFADNPPEAKNGELDLRNWDFEQDGIVTLSGEWAFYPYTFLQEVPTADAAITKKIIPVPGDWSPYLNEDDHSPYGYGTYHLRIFVEPSLDKTYSVRIPSVRSTSAIYINGQLAGNSGQVAETAEENVDRNIPYTSSTIRVDESGIIDIVLQVANYADPRSSGLIREVKFGFEKDVIYETHLSIMLQTVAAVIFTIVALFSVVIYFFGVKDARLLYFALAIFSLSFISLNAGDEKVLFEYVQVNYTYLLRFMFFVVLIMFWAILQTLRNEINVFSPIILRIVTVIYVIFVMLAVFVPLKWLNYLFMVEFSFIILQVILVIFALLFAKNSIINELPISFAIIAIINHVFWVAYMILTGTKTIYYPFDLIIAVISFAILWLKNYYQSYQQTLLVAKQLAEIDKIKDEFLVNTSHELRNPLNSILNISEAMLNREKNAISEESKKNLQTIISVSRRMSLMLHELLDISAIKEGIPKLNVEPTSIQAVTSGVIDMLSYSVEGRQVKLMNRIPRDFPLVLADENRLTQVIFNLLQNAVKFTYEGEIEVSAAIKDNQAVIAVRDTGIGIDEESLPFIFKPYEKGTNSKNNLEGGFGLGLFVSKQLIELHKGTLNVKSKLGEGSTFTFTLPLAKAGKFVVETDGFIYASSEESAAAAIEMEEQQHEERKKNRPKVIIVDDDPVNVNVIKTILGERNYDITTVLNAKDVLALLNEGPWELVISDVMMPEISGYELTKKIRERFSMSDLPVLLVTARTGRKNIEQAFKSGANDYITKPVDSIELQARVKALTDLRKSMDERLRLEAAWLQAQIKPHFLFNTLNSVIALSQIDVERMNAVLQSFSEVLRAKFNFENINDLTTIENELSVIESYLHIEKERFGDRLKVEWDVDDDINVLIPILSLQPLVENAVNHGVMNRNEGGTVTVSLKSYDEYVEIIVSDDGDGIEQEILEQIYAGTFNKDSGVGLINIDLRLKRFYGKGLEIVSSPKTGTTVSFRVPRS